MESKGFGHWMASMHLCPEPDTGAIQVDRQTVDLSAYPDLVVVYLGMRVNRLYGLRTLMGYGRK
jgi:hypothetical protein